MTSVRMGQQAGEGSRHGRGGVWNVGSGYSGGRNTGRAEPQHVHHAGKMDVRLWRRGNGGYGRLNLGYSSRQTCPDTGLGVPRPRTGPSGTEVRGGEPQGRAQCFYFKAAESHGMNLAWQPEIPQRPNWTDHPVQQGNVLRLTSGPASPH